MPSQTLELARSSLRRLRQIDEELEVIHSRVGGQGTGFGPMIDHNVILDVMRNVDEEMEAEVELPREGEICKDDLDKAWVVLFGMDALIADDGIDEATREAISYAMALRYLYAKPWRDIPKVIGDHKVAGKGICKMTLRWLDTRGLAHIRAAAREACDGGD